MKKKKKDKMWKSYFEILCISLITLLQIFVYGCFSHALYPDITKSEINLKLKVKMNNILICSFLIGVDHSNPYIHRTTIL